MNENIDLTKILMDCPKGWKLWSPIFGEIEFYSIVEKVRYPIMLSCKKGIIWFSKDGLFDIENEDAECILFPSKDQRDWSKFIAPWFKRKRFDPKTLKPFDKVLVRNDCSEMWRCNFFSHISGLVRYPYATIENNYRYCIPFNDGTIYIAGARKEAPEYYRYWED